MNGLRWIVVCAALTAMAAAPAAAQRGLGIGRGFTGIGLGNWALHEGGADSLATWYGLGEEQREQLRRLAAEFRNANADALQRWQQMQLEIEALWSGNQYPTRAAVFTIGQKYGHPGLELQPALDRLQVQAGALLTPGQWQWYGRRPYLGRGGGWGMGFRRVYPAYRAYRGGGGYRRWLGWPPRY